MQPAPTPETLPWWGRLSTLYLMTAPLALFLYALGLPLTPNDYWYHVRAGFLHQQLGHIPTTNLMSDGVPLAHPYYYQSWLAEWAMYSLLRWGGLSWTLIFRAAWLCLLWAILVAAIYRRMRRLLPALEEKTIEAMALEKGAAKYAALGGFVGLMLAFNNVDIRPQLFSYLFFAVFAAALFDRPYTGRHRTLMLIGLPLLMAVWANTHGAFVTGLILLGALAGGELLHALWERRAGRDGAGHDGAGCDGTAHPWAFLGVLLLLCAAAALANPRGAQIYIYVMNLAGDPASQRYIQEWQSPSGRRLHDWFFFIALAWAVGAFTFDQWRSHRPGRGRRLERGHRAGNGNAPAALWPSELLVLLMLAVMGLRDMRAIIWFALWTALCAPPLVAALRATLGKAAPAPATDTSTAAATPARGLAGLNVAVALLLVLGCVPLLPWLKYRLDLPRTYTKRFAPTPQTAYPRGFAGEPPLLLDRETPVEAAAWLQKHPPRGRLFNDMVYGSYLTWALYPQTRPYAEPRVELYGLPFWTEYLRLGHGPPDAARRLQEQGFSAALLHPESQKGLIARLQSAPQWTPVRLPGPARLFVLREPK